MVIFLFSGVFFSCSYLECNAFKYNGYSQDQHNGRPENTFIDSFGHYRSRRNVDGNMTSCENCTKTRDDHKYYVSEIVKDGQRYWREIQGNPKTVEKHGLSDHFLQKQELKLSFRFPYYGHFLKSVVLTTGGFLYMDTHDTTLITEVQYLAPLMAYFSSQMDENSKIYTLDDGTQLTVQWFNVSVHNKTDAGRFNFQCTLHKNGTIWFAYKEIPVPVDSIQDSNHPVRVGLSDAFVIYVRHSERPIIYRIFFIYSQVNITKDSIVSGSAVVFHPLPSCVSANSCPDCMRLSDTTEFECQWCPATKRCSDGADRYRAEWHKANCYLDAVKQSSDKRCLAGVVKPRKSSGGIGAGAIVGICIVLVLVFSVAAWCVYAYRHPTSKSGLMLIDATRLPRQLFKRSGGSTNTGDAAPSDIKPEVL